MRVNIPTPVISVISRILPMRNTADGMDNLFRYAGAPGDPPAGGKAVRAEAWLRFVNKDLTVDPLDVLGKVLEEIMEGLSRTDQIEEHAAHRTEVETVLAKCNLAYVSGGRIVGSLGTPSRNLEGLIRERDLASVDVEFERAMKSIESSPREAISAASNILEIICKVIIEDETLDMPSKEDLASVWNVVRKFLGIDPSIIEDQDLQKILSGLISTVGGIGSLRTHASTAHGNSHKSYKILPRHARLAVHASHTIAMFVLESWAEKKNRK